MRKYRDKLRIITDILSITSKGAKKTQVMYQANLSYALTNRYLTELMNAGLVSFEGSVDRYKLTRKGREFLSKFDEYSRRCKQLEQQINEMNNERTVLKKMVSSNPDTPNGE